MTAVPARTLVDLDLGVASRQAFSGTYERPKHLDAAIARHRDGILRLPPHPDWTGDYTDWTADPLKDRNWQFQHHTLRWVNPLRWAAMEGDEYARAEWLRVARSWYEANVPAETAVGPFAWKDMADGNRAIQFSLGAPFVPAGEEWFVRLLEAHRDWLMDDANIVRGNHGLHQNSGLIVVGAVLRDHAAIETAQARMAEQFQLAFDDQGCNNEGSTAYHQMNIRWWRQGWARLRAEGIDPPPEVAARLTAACSVLAHLAQPDGALPQIGDSARAKLTDGLSGPTDYVLSAGQRGEHPGTNSVTLKGGYATSRSGWGEQRDAKDESHLVVRHGRFRRAHGHYDSGSLHIYTAGRRWLTDPGFHSYQTGDATRKYLASRQAHNVPLLQSRDRDETVPFELISSESTPVADDFRLVDNGYEDAQLERRVLYLRDPDCWIVWDSVRADAEVTLAQHWQADVGVKARYRERGFRLSDSGRSLQMTWLGGAPRLRRHDAFDDDLTGWIGTRWKTLEPATRLTAKTTGEAAQLITLIGAHAPVALGVVDSYVTRSGVLTVGLVRGNDWWSFTIDGSGTRMRVH